MVSLENNNINFEFNFYNNNNNNKAKKILKEDFMCGIVGYIGKNNAIDIVMNGLCNLEYRGYDSSGIAFLDNGKIDVVKSVGRINNLKEKLKKNYSNSFSNIAIGHTRWATHGVPSDENSHPHLSMNEKFSVVHNGIIENYLNLKNDLKNLNFSFKSDTDTEVVANLLENLDTGDFLTTVFEMKKKIEGSFAFGILKKDTNELISTREGSPLVVGIAKDGFYIASDIIAILKYTRDIIYLENGDLIHFKDNSYKIYDRLEKPVKREIKHIDWSVETATKDGFDHFMLKEIFEQPKAISETLLRRLDEKNNLSLEGLDSLLNEDLKKFNKCYIVACGTAFHAGLVGKNILEKAFNFSVVVDIASEFRYANRFIDEKTLVIIISQSGETADTLAALREAKKNHAKVLSITNVVGSSIARESDNVFYTFAGPEIAVASTKAYTTQLVSLYMIALKIGSILNTISVVEYEEIIENLKLLPEKIKDMLKDTDIYKSVAMELKDKFNCFYLGRGLDYYTAMESALKLKEISYIYTESFAAGELKHGPIALIENGTVVFVIATQRKLYEKVISNIKEVKARGAKVVEITQIKNTYSVSDVKILIPSSIEILMPIISVIASQLISYYASIEKGNDVDKPRNLAKSVTVE